MSNKFVHFITFVLRNFCIYTADVLEAEISGKHTETIELNVTLDIAEVKCRAFVRDSKNETIEAKFVVELNGKLLHRIQQIETFNLQSIIA